MQGGTTRWMSPELIDPKEFGFNTCRCTRESDCYALGIVFYEVISGNVPFHSQHKEFKVALEILKGNRPSRDAEFADPLWEMLQMCWKPQPSDRPKIEDVLRCLESVSELSRPPSPPADHMVTSEEDADGWNSEKESFGKISNFVTYAKPHGLHPLHECRLDFIYWRGPTAPFGAPSFCRPLRSAVCGQPDGSRTGDPAAFEATSYNH